MKSLISTLSSLVIATTGGNLSSFLTTNFNYNLDLNNKIEISEDIGINSINESFTRFEVLINSQRLRNWAKIINEDELFKIILTEIQDPKIFQINNPKAQFDEIAKFISKKMTYIVSLPHIAIYGIEIIFGGLLPNSFKPQFSLDKNNSSYTQENFHTIGYNDLNIFISRKQWENIYATNQDIEKITNILNQFPQDPAINKDEISQQYIKMMAQMILKEYEKINSKFQETITNTGWIVKGNTNVEVKSIDSQNQQNS